MKVALALAASLAVSASTADGPIFNIRVGCHEGLPIGFQIEAKRAGTVVVPMTALFAACEPQEEPQMAPQRWQDGA